MALSSSRRDQISDFNASVRSTLERHLPPAEERAVTDSASQNQLGKRTRTAMETSDSTVMALQAAQVLHDQGYFSKKGLQQVFAGAAMGGAGRPCWRLTSIYRQCVRSRHPPQVNASWMCNNCTELGHHQLTCTNQAHPDAKKIVAEYRRQQQNVRQRSPRASFQRSLWG